MDDPTIIRTFTDRGEAEIARSLLEAEGIDAELTSDDMGGNTPPLSLSAGLQLVVPGSAAEQARALLDESVSAEELEAAERESEEPGR
jgi:hypothetical protein